MFHADHSRVSRRRGGAARLGRGSGGAEGGDDRHRRRAQGHRGTISFAFFLGRAISSPLSRVVSETPTLGFHSGTPGSRIPSAAFAVRADPGRRLSWRPAGCRRGVPGHSPGQGAGERSEHAGGQQSLAVSARERVERRRRQSAGSATGRRARALSSASSKPSGWIRVNGATSTSSAPITAAIGRPCQGVSACSRRVRAKYSTQDQPADAGGHTDTDRRGQSLA